jgi:2,4-dienoyl-CoA reductase-like NADH-dependent reductase (Old Yellow Enzyme family)/thioredoxin reductase
MKAKTPLKKIFQPIQIGSLRIKNRIAMAPMGSRYANEEGEVTDRMVEYYSTRARGEVGLVTVESTYIKYYPGRLQISDDKFIPGLKRLSEGIHNGGAKAAIQIQTRKGRDDLIDPVCASPIPHPKSGKVPRELSVTEISKIITDYGKGAKRAKQSGFDAIMIHGASGYLICEFLSPLANKRKDEYGGSLENRAKLATDIVASTRFNVGPDFPVIFRMCADEHVIGGISLSDAVPFAKLLEDAGVDLIDVTSGSMVHTYEWVMLPYGFPEKTNVKLADKIKKAVKIPVMVCGRLKDPATAETVIKEGKADLISIGRALFADPEWAHKVKTGNIDDIRPCISCVHCHIPDLSNKLGVSCAVNAVSGREVNYNKLTSTKVQKKILIAGGGPAGLEAARVAALRGHKVILCEKSSKIGGLMLLGAVHNEEITNFVEWMQYQLEKLPVEIYFQTEINHDLVAEIKPDVLILAIGGAFIVPNIPGIDNDNVFSAQDLLNIMHGYQIKQDILKRAFAPIARHLITAQNVKRILGSNYPIKKNVTVIGGQFPGCSLSLLLANKGKNVTILEESNQYGKLVPPNIMIGLDKNIAAGRVRIITEAKLEEIHANGLIYKNKDGARILHETDSIILALELSKSENKIADELEGNIKEIYTIGDAKSFGRISNAILEGYNLSYKL